MSASVRRPWRPGLLFLLGLILGTAGMAFAYIRGWAEVSIFMGTSEWIWRMVLTALGVGVALGTTLAIVAKMRNQRLDV